jgi:tripartite-type tricarboxylate transporter receptor subunit TctC
MKKSMLTASLLTAVAALAWPASAVKADSAADFYKGRTVTIYVGVSPGGIYSTFALMLSKYLGNHMAGNPKFVIQHMRGAGGTKAVNYVYNVAPHDGSVLITPNAGITKRVVLGIGKPRYDPSKLQWMGGWGEAVNTLTLRKDITPVMTLNEAKQKVAVLGAIGKSSNTFMLPNMMNNVIGTKFKIISGYRGGSPIRKAIATGELHGWAGQWMGWKMRLPDWVRDGKIVHLVQMASKRAPDLPNVPLLTEFAKNDEERAMFTFIQTAIADRAFAAPPGVPADRVAALTKAYWATLHDPAFLAETSKRQYRVDPVSAKDVTAFVNKVMNTPPAMIARLKTAMGLKK